VCGGYEKCAPDFDINRNNYPYHFMKCTIKGKGTLTIKDQPHELRPGVVSGFSPGTPHHYIADPHDPMEHLFFTFVGTEADMLLKTALLTDKRIIKPKNPSEILDIIQKIFTIGSEKKQFSQTICCYYLRILSCMLGQDSCNQEKNLSQSLITYLPLQKNLWVTTGSGSAPRL
jgi:hypothetical protein